MAICDCELMDMAPDMPPLRFELRLLLTYAAAATMDHQNGYRSVNGTRDRSPMG